jgi:hypothetical protein
MAFRGLIRKRITIYLLVNFVVMIVVITSVIGITISRTSREDAVKYALEITRSIALELDSLISQHQMMAVTIASILGSDPSKDRVKVKKLLFDLFDKSEWIVATYAGYEPDAFDGNDKPWRGAPTHTLQGQFVPFVHTYPEFGMIHDLSKAFVDSLRDIDKWDFYQGPKRTNAPFITPPWTYRDPNTNVLQKIVCLTAPIKWPDGTFRGMAGVNIDTGALLKKFNSFQVFEHGLVFIIFRDGMLLTYPDEDITFTKTILDIRDRFGDADLDKLVADIAAGRSGWIDGLHPISKRKSLIVYYPVKTSEWGVVMVAPLSDIQANRNSLILAIVAILVFLNCIFLLAVRFVT